MSVSALNRRIRPKTVAIALRSFNAASLLSSRSISLAQSSSSAFRGALASRLDELCNWLTGLDVLSLRSHGPDQLYQAVLTQCSEHDNAAH
jgi:hypothetical protein